MTEAEPLLDSNDLTYVTNLLQEFAESGNENILGKIDQHFKQPDNPVVPISADLAMVVTTKYIELATYLNNMGIFFNNIGKSKAKLL